MIYTNRGVLSLKITSLTLAITNLYKPFLHFQHFRNSYLCRCNIQLTMHFNFHPLSLLPITLTALSSVTTLRAQGLGCDLFPKCCELVEACKKTPSNTVSWSPDSMFTDLNTKAMVTQYDNGVINAWADRQCMPYVVNGSIAKGAVFCQTVNCRGYAQASFPFFSHLL
jgi:hypothetical protein